MDSLLTFLLESRKLKDVKRRGATLYGKDEREVESNADHAFSLALLAWVFTDIELRRGVLDIHRLMKMALIHDLGKVYAGDATPYDDILKKLKRSKDKHEILLSWPEPSVRERMRFSERKYERERKGFEELIRHLPPALKDEFLSLWMDYERSVSREARFLSQLVVFDNLLQAVQYHKQDPSFPTTPWLMHAREAIDEPVLLQYLHLLEERVWHKPQRRVQVCTPRRRRKK